MTDSSNLQKYKSKNPVRKFLLNRFMLKISGIFRQVAPQKALDAGCGEGLIIEYLNKMNKLQKMGKTIEFFGIDMSENAIDIARIKAPFATFSTGNVYTLPFPDNFFDLVICSEVLEHLKDPEIALKELGRVSKKDVLVSVPNEPWFRISSFLSGKYLKNWGNHPEHIQNWSMPEFIRFVKKEINIMSAEISFPWIIVLGEKK